VARRLRVVSARFAAVFDPQAPPFFAVELPFRADAAQLGLAIGAVQARLSSFVELAAGRRINREVAMQTVRAFTAVGIARHDVARLPGFGRWRAGTLSRAIEAAQQPCFADVWLTRVRRRCPARSAGPRDVDTNEPAALDILATVKTASAVAVGTMLAQRGQRLAHGLLVIPAIIALDAGLELLVPARLVGPCCWLHLHFRWRAPPFDRLTDITLRAKTVHVASHVVVGTALAGADLANAPATTRLADDAVERAAL
jgi:hypothetical protein